jgi:predicted phage terminase large subunit-like protein
LLSILSPEEINSLGWKGIATLQKTVWENQYIPHTPYKQQRQFLAYDGIEGLYGGSAGGGKSDCLLIGALQYVGVPGYAALLLRRTYADLSLPGALMDRAFQWLGDANCHWDDQQKVWTFPSGATITFGYLETERDKYRYQSSEFQFVAFDELTQFTETQYTYLFSRLRRLKDFPVPIRMRAASNPGGVGHQWVRDHFPIDTLVAEDCIFVPARMDDNPYIDHESYEKALDRLDYVTREQLRHGDWNISISGGIFRPEKMHTIAVNDIMGCSPKIYGACDPSEGASDFASIVTVLVLPDGRWVPFACDMSVDIQSATIDKIIELHKVYRYDKIWIEANSLGHAKSAPGESLFEMELKKRQLEAGVIVPYEFIWNTGKKEDRIRALEPYYSNGQLAFLDDWKKRYPMLIDQLKAFPTTNHDDGPDSLAICIKGVMEQHFSIGTPVVIPTLLTAPSKWMMGRGLNKWN